MAEALPDLQNELLEFVEDLFFHRHHGLGGPR